MRIQYRESGGFAGLQRGCSIDSDQLSDADRALLNAAVDQVPDSVNARSAQARDARQHEITIETGGRTLRISVDDAAAPAAVRPLLKFLQQRAKPIPIS